MFAGREHNRNHSHAVKTDGGGLLISCNLFVRLRLPEMGTKWGWYVEPEHGTNGIGMRAEMRLLHAWPLFSLYINIPSTNWNSCSE